MKLILFLRRLHILERKNCDRTEEKVLLIILWRFNRRDLGGRTSAFAAVTVNVVDEFALNRMRGQLEGIRLEELQRLGGGNVDVEPLVDGIVAVEDRLKEEHT